MNAQASTPTLSDDEKQNIVHELMQKFESNEISYEELTQAMRKKIPADPTLTMAFVHNFGSGLIQGLDLNFTDLVAKYGEDWHSKSTEAVKRDFISAVFDVRQAHEIYKKTSQTEGSDEDTPEKRLYSMAHKAFIKALKLHAGEGNTELGLVDQFQFHKALLVFEQDSADKTLENEVDFAEQFRLLRAAEADLFLLAYEPARYAKLYSARPADADSPDSDDSI